MRVSPACPGGEDPATGGYDKNHSDCANRAACRRPARLSRRLARRDRGADREARPGRPALPAQRVRGARGAARGPRDPARQALSGCPRPPREEDPQGPMSGLTSPRPGGIKTPTYPQPGVPWAPNRRGGRHGPGQRTDFPHLPRWHCARLSRRRDPGRGRRRASRNRLARRRSRPPSTAPTGTCNGRSTRTPPSPSTRWPMTARRWN